MPEPYRDDRDALQLRIEELRAERAELEEAIARGVAAHGRLPTLLAYLSRLEQQLDNRGSGARPRLSKQWLWILRGGTLGSVAALCAAYLAPFPLSRCPSRTSSALVRAQAIHSAVELWQSDLDEPACPDLDALVVGKKLDAHKTTDPWGTPYRIACTGDEVRVWSSGKDKLPGTADDIADDFRRADLKRVSDL